MNVRKTVLKSFLVPLVSVLALSVSACGEDKASQDAQAQAVPHSIKVGVVPGPYREMLDLYLKPVVQKKGHDLKFVEFTDWVQPDSALASGDIDANVFQHQSYLNGIVENQGLKLSSVVNVPTLGIFAFSDKYKSFDEVQDGATVGIPNDPVNLARALRVARDLKVIGLDPNKDEQKASLADIKDNPKHLKFTVMEAAQLPRSLDSIDLAFVPGNYAYAAKLDFTKALGAEDVKEPIKLVVAVQDSKVDTIGKFLKEAVLDPDFAKGVDQDKVFSQFAKPNWWPK
ncbi:MAG: MetQ/NlpA family ABC transporter substrate-binding protein [Succinivibrio sp.]|nr:MetQ/NlpA family ABC transporter substrate-binding protein [Succinivibrio sp.]MCI7773952.1 MetQ/NlpA family ABC transporter substrate-binding protein [Succinivibrio sp.]MDY5324696.1 MetQ/NlpA family ABC transporter substrate-binding protein [Succinivibrio sp.]